MSKPFLEKNTGHNCSLCGASKPGRRDQENKLLIEPWECNECINMFHAHPAVFRFIVKVIDTHEDRLHQFSLGDE